MPTLEGGSNKIRTAILLAAATLAIGSGCASRPPAAPENIIVVNVAGTWRSSDGEAVQLTLAQEGSNVSGTLLTVAGSNNMASEALIVGTVTGKAFHFTQAAGGISIEGQMTVNNDAMTGELRNASASGTPRRVDLRRVDASRK
jgi:hypothetical protein